MKALYNKMAMLLCVTLCTTLISVCPVFAAEEMTYNLDLSGNIAVDWVLGSGAKGTAATVTKDQNQIQSPNDQTVNSYYNAIRWSGKYIYRLDVKNEYGADANQAVILFNFKNGANYYSINIGGCSKDKPNNHIWLMKTIGGSTSIIKSAEYNTVASDFTTMEVTYDNGYITFKTITGGQERLIFDRVKETTITEGKIGVGSVNSIADFKNISVVGTGTNVMLRVDSTNLTNTQNVSLTPEIRTTFNVKLQAETLTKMKLNKDNKLEGNVGIYSGSDSAPIYLPVDDFNVQLENGNTIIVTVNKKLQEKTTYTFIINTSVVSADYGEGLPTNYKLVFTTKPPIFDIVSYDILAINNQSIKNNINGSKGNPATIKINIKNNEIPGSQPYAITAAIVNGSQDSGKMVYSKVFKGALNTGESANLTASLVIPDTVNSTSTLVVYMLNSFENMQVMNPKEPILFNDSDFINADIDFKNDGVTLSGILPNNEKGRNLNLVVINPGKDINNISTDSNVLQKQATLVTGENGTFSVTFPIFFNNQSVSGNYKVFLCGDDFTQPKEYEFYFALRPERVEAINAINSAVDTASMLQQIDNNKVKLSLQFEPFNAIEKTKLAKLTLDQVKKAPFDTSDASIIRSFIREKSILEAYNQEKSEVLFSKDDEFLYPEILKLNLLENAPYNLTAYNFYNNLLNDSGKKKVHSAMLGNNFETVEHLQHKFIEEVVVFGINNCNKRGYGHIKPLMTENNSIYIEGKDPIKLLDLSKYKSNLADSKLIIQTIDSLDTLQKLIIEYSKESGGSTGGSGGSIGGSGRTDNSYKILGELPKTELPVIDTTPVVKTVELKDMDDAEWAVEPVKGLIKNKVITEPADGKFRPNDNITRAEFVKMIVLALKLDTSKTESVFEDVTADDWSAPYVAAAKTAGIINGIDEKNFGKDNQITRQDVAAIIYRAFKPQAPSTEEQISKFADSDTIAEYAAQAVEILNKLNIINGMEDGRFAPTDNCTRAQSAKIIYGMMK